MLFQIKIVNSGRGAYLGVVANQSRIVKGFREFWDRCGYLNYKYMLSGFQ